MLFSILVANYNNGHFFKDCYTSIMEQSYEQWECIIVDDGSTDDSLNIINKIIGEDDRFKVYTNDKNEGCGYTKAKCADLAHGKICGFLDPDDTLHECALEIMTLNYLKNPEASIVTSTFAMVDLNLKIKTLQNHGSKIPEGKSYLTYGKGALTAFATFNKEKYDKTVGIDKSMTRAVDQDLYYKMEEQGEHFFVDKVLYYYRINENSISANANLFKAQYWQFYTKIKAYKRRMSSYPLIDNFSSLQIKKMKSNFYFSRFERSKEKKQFCKKYYFLFKSIYSFPIYKIRLKLNSLYR